MGFQLLLDFHPAFLKAFVGVEHSAQHLCGLVHAIFDKARVIPQHTLLDNTEGPS